MENGSLTMKSFTDNVGRVWTVNVNVGTVKRVRALCNVDIASIVTMETDGKPKIELLERLANDPVLLVDVLYAVCKEEADAKNVSDEEFGRAMAGDSIEKATAALLDEIIDFFPEAKRRVFAKILAATRRFQEKTKEELAKLLDDPALDGKIDAALEQLTLSSSNLPESAE
jgi:hypothetical protein